MQDAAHQTAEAIVASADSKCMYTGASITLGGWLTSNEFLGWLVDIVVNTSTQGTEMKLIENASKCWKMFSIQAMSLAGAIQMAWIAMPEDLKTSIPSDAVQYVTFALLIFGTIGRVIKQDSVEPK